MKDTSRVLLMLGAGFSAPFGVPTMRPFFIDFIEFARRNYPSLGTTLDRVLEDVSSEADLERLLAKLNIAVTADQSLYPGLLAQEVHDWVRDCTRLRAHLLAYIVERCEQFRRGSVVEYCSALLLGLSTRRSVVFSTNYDRVIEYACEVAGIDLADGFGRGKSELVGPWSGKFDSDLALAKLHGSVTWYVEGDDDSNQYLRLDRGYPLPGPDFHLAREGEFLRPLMIVPTLEKQFLDRPYADLLLLLGRTLETSNLLVAIGTSFRDKHLVNQLRLHSPNLVILVVARSTNPILERLTGFSAVGIDVPTEVFLQYLTPDLMALIDDVNSVDKDSDSEVIEHVNQFIEDANRKLAVLEQLSPEQIASLDKLIRGNPTDQLSALADLRGTHHDDVIAATMDALSSSDPEVRAAASGNLGTVQSSAAVACLQTLVRQDNSELVRLEALLGLQKIANAEARTALEVLRAEFTSDGLWRYLESDPTRFGTSSN